MSDIKVGDLVMVVRAGPCGCDKPEQRIFRVAEIGFFQMNCRYCGNERENTAARIEGWPLWVDVFRLKRIPPLSELDGAREVLSEREPTKAKA